MLLGQCPQQRSNQLGPQAGHVPVESHRLHLVQRGQGNVHRGTVVGGAGVEAVGDGEVHRVAAGHLMVPHGGEVEHAGSTFVADEVLQPHQQQLGLGAARRLPPLVEVAGAHHLRAQPPVVVREHGFLVHEVGAAHPLAPALEIAEEALVVAPELVGGPIMRAPFAVHQRTADEQLACGGAVHAVVAHRTVADDGQPEQ